MRQRLVGHGPLHHPNWQLMGHDDDVSAVNGIDGVAHRGQHPLCDVEVRLTPRRTQRVHEKFPEVWAGCDRPSASEIHPPKFVPRFNDALIDNRR